MTPEQRDAPIYQTFSELFAKGFTLDTVTWVFVLAIHVAAVLLGVWVGLAAPQEWMTLAIAWTVAHFVIGSMSTTVYSHRLITHRAVKTVSVPSISSSVLSVKYSAFKVAFVDGRPTTFRHHGVDRHGKRSLTLTVRLGFPIH